MPAPPKNKKSANLTSPKVSPVVTIDGKETTLWKCAGCGMYAGRRRNWADLVRDFTENPERLQDLKLQPNGDRLVEVWKRDAAGKLDQCLFTGVVVSQSVEVSDGSEQLNVRAEMADHLFGAPVKGMEIWNPVTDSKFTVDGDLVFQPVIDGEVEDNRSGKTDPDRDYSLFVDPESMRTVDSRLNNGQGILEWDLPSATKYLLGSLNSTELFAKNKSRTEDDDDLQIRNVTIPVGTYLPEALDLLLIPHGYQWSIALEKNEDGELQKNFRIYKQGKGVERKLFLQPSGGNVDRQKTNARGINVEFNISDMATRVIGYGARQRREMTIEMFPAWAESDDSLTADQLKKTDPSSQYFSKPHVWRLWVANEAGDYNLLRETLAPIPDYARDFSGSFNGLYPRRRVFEQCLTMRTEGPDTGEEDDTRYRPWPVYVEYYDYATETWQPVNGGYIVRSDQLAIEFAEDEPPEEIMAQFDPGNDQFPIVRVTGTVTGDKRLVKESNDLTGSPSSREIVLSLDLSDRFLDDARVTEGGFKSELPANDPSLERDDAEALQEFVDNVADTESAAVVGGAFPLSEIRTDYQLGQLLTNVEGRNISLNRFTGASGKKRYPQITGIEWDFNEQRTTILAEPIDAIS